MARSASDYVASLRDGRRVFYRGVAVPDVTQHPVFRIAIAHASIDYEMAEDPEWRELALVDGHSRYFAPPRTAEDLRKRSRLITEATAQGATLVVLIKEIGSDALFALSLLASRLGGPYPERVAQFLAHCRDADLAVAVAQTDVKGDRSARPSQQPNPNSYLRVTDRRSDGIVVRGVKCHTSVSVNANELIVLPTREMAEPDSDYAVAFAIPVDTPGLTLVASPYGDNQGKSDFQHPISAHHKMVETTTIFDDVFVAWDRVFLCGEWAEAGRLAREFVEFHRFTAVSYKLPLVDALLGCAMLAAEMNGTQRAGHIREKLAWLVMYVATLKELVERSADACQIDAATGIAIPDPLVVNLAKLHFAEKYHTALQHLQDIAGGITVSAPSLEDFNHPEIGPLLDAAFRGASRHSGIERIRLMNLISELTTGDFGGYQAVLAIHAEGSLEAEKITIVRSYDSGPARDYARRLLSLEA